MTALLDRLTGTDDLEAAPTPAPQPALPVPGTSSIPWWTGVPGLYPHAGSMTGG